jgi:hypothetical protein
MRVKTFTGIDANSVDEQVNNWLAENRVTPVKTGTAF